MENTERVHHDFSPSTLQFLEACPAYRSKQGGKLHPRTIIGTMSHEVSETGEDNLRLGDEDMEKVAECIDFYEQRRLAMVAKRNDAVDSLAFSFFNTHSNLTIESQDDASLLAEKKVPQILEIKETYLAVDDLNFQDGGVSVNSTTGGYIDCGLISHCRTKAELFDWKFGMWPVEDAENNLQGIAYALGLFRAYPTLKEVLFTFKQPNIDHITSHTFTRDSVPALYLRVQTVVARARAARLANTFETATPRVPACNFCANIGICPKVATMICTIGAKFFPLEIPANITPTMVHSETDTKLGLQLAAVVAVWAEAFKSRVTDRVLRRDAPCPDGYRIETRTPREIADGAKYKEVAMRYLTDAEYQTTLTETFGKVEGLIGDKQPRGQKSGVVKEFKQSLEDEGAVVRGMPYSFLRAESKKKSAE